MKNADESIEKVLAGLRTTGPTPGIERRILNTLDAMQAHESTGAEMGWRRLLPLWLATPRPIATVSLAFALGLAALIVIFVTSQHFGLTPVRSENERTKSAAVSTPLPAASEPKEKFDNRVGHGFSHDILPQQSSRALAPEVHLSSAERTSLAEDPQPLDAAFAPSFPAPPMALTEQERLLLHLAHRHDPANLALLNPAQQETQIAKDAAQFQEFFEKPPTPADPANPPTDNPPPQDAQIEDDAAQSPAPAAQPTMKKR